MVVPRAARRAVSMGESLVASKDGSRADESVGESVGAKAALLGY